MRKQHVVVLSEQERARLHTLIGQGSAPARALTHARILLKANQGEAGPGWSDRAIATALEVHHVKRCHHLLLSRGALEPPLVPFSCADPDRLVVRRRSGRGLRP